MSADNVIDATPGDGFAGALIVGGQHCAAELVRYAAKARLSPYLHYMKVRDAIKMIEEDGWFLVRTKGSHRQFKHVGKPGLVTVPGKPSDELAPGTLNSILKQAGLKP